MLYGIALALITGYLALALLLFVFQARLIYFPERELVATPNDVELAYEDVHLETSDGVKLHGWLVPALASHAPTLIFFHGNAGNISHRLDSLLLFHRLGLSTLIVDYRGYGRSEGRPTEQGTYRDAQAAWQFLTETRRVPPQSIVLIGRSLGAAVATWLAARTRPAALVIESGFVSIRQLAAHMYPFLPVRLLARFRYDSRSQLPQVRCPVLVAHSTQDEMIPFDHARTLFAAATPPRVMLVMRGGHNDGFVVSGEDYTRGLKAFVDVHASTGASGLAGHSEEIRLH